MYDPMIATEIKKKDEEWVRKRRSSALSRWPYPLPETGLSSVSAGRHSCNISAVRAASRLDQGRPNAGSRRPRLDGVRPCVELARTGNRAAFCAWAPFMNDFRHSCTLPETRQGPELGLQTEFERICRRPAPQHVMSASRTSRKPKKYPGGSVMTRGGRDDTGYLHLSPRGQPGPGCASCCAQFGDDGRVVAGGHSLIPMMKLRLARPAHLVDISRHRRAEGH